ncbi:MAG TPA: hypothetical protein PKC22_00265 [Rhodocyclaceae bacterium]|nr:hypothetical protein [Rhodocyclaceae bacterium]
MLLKFDPARASDWLKGRAPILCTCCGAVMKIVRTRIPPRCTAAPSGPPAACVGVLTM